MVGRHHAVSLRESGDADSHLVHDPYQFMPENGTGGLRSVVQLEEVCAA
jgi:ABC-type tungstate transport system permease subunit